MRRDGLSAALTLPQCGKTRPEQLAGGGALLEGRWRLHWTREELIAVGVARHLMKDAPESATVTLEFKDGRFRAIADGVGVVATGRYTVEGDVMSLVYDAPAPPGYVPGNVYRQSWSIFRRSLRFPRVPGSDVDFVLLVNPLWRVE
jgi:hypothetical protein